MSDTKSGYWSYVIPEPEHLNKTYSCITKGRYRASCNKNYYVR